MNALQNSEISTNLAVIDHQATKESHSQLNLVEAIESRAQELDQDLRSFINNKPLTAVLYAVGLGFGAFLISKTFKKGA